MPDQTPTDPSDPQRVAYLVPQSLRHDLDRWLTSRGLVAVPERDHPDDAVPTFRVRPRSTRREFRSDLTGTYCASCGHRIARHGLIPETDTVTCSDCDCLTRHP